MVKKTLITILGWEDRFRKGFQFDFENYKFNQCLVFIYKQYQIVTAESYNELFKFCKFNEIEIIVHELENENALGNWLVIQSAIEKILDNGNQIILDISTTPRETLWTILFFLKQKLTSITYIYHKPLRYDEWLSREPENPRLLFKHSGIMSFDKPTLLFAFTGFDIERIIQLVNFYEPKKSVLLIQKGLQYDNSERNSFEKYKSELRWLSNVDFFEADSYDLDACYSQIKGLLDDVLETYNVIATSQGPKISGLALYKYFNLNKSIALSYVPCKEYNPLYSRGCDGFIQGVFTL
jgi:hypothetical protein